MAGKVKVCNLQVTGLLSSINLDTSRSYNTGKGETVNAPKYGLPQISGRRKKTAGIFPDTKILLPVPSWEIG